MLDGGYQYSMLTSGKEWAKQLPNMYIWLDYCCIPQPGAAAGGVHAAQHSDHREGEGDLVAQLKAAVNSIPSYLARSTMMWILVPPVKHESRWRARSVTTTRGAGAAGAASSSLRQALRWG